MDSPKPWCGACEKVPQFFVLLFEATTDERDVVLEYTAATGEN